MNEWPILVKYSVGVALFVMLLGVVSTVMYISNSQAGKQADAYASKVSYEDFSQYHDRVVDKPTVRNILRANKERLPIYIDGSPDPISDDPSIAHMEINMFLDNTTTKYKILIEDTNSGVVMRVNKN